MRLPIYLDNMATTPVYPQVKQKMNEYLSVDDEFGNPASSGHIYGIKAREAVELARAQVAALINAESREIVWTSGATEATNLALKGAASFYARKGKHIITCKTEHKSVLEVCRYLQNQDFDVTYLTPQKNGLIDLDELASALRPDTILVSIMFVNNEIGVIQDIAAIAELLHSKGVIFHVDAAQASGKVAVDVKKLAVDLMSLSAHKAYGPKGVGALYVRQQPRRLHLEPQIHGGGHEFGLRSGTLATHQIAGMGEAFDIVRREMEATCARIRGLRDKLWSEIEPLGDVYLNGDFNHRVAHNLNVSFAGVRGVDLFAELKNLAISSGSACTSASVEPSHVLTAIGVSNALAHSSIRFTLSTFTTEDEIDYAISEVKRAVIKLRG